LEKRELLRELEKNFIFIKFYFKNSFRLSEKKIIQRNFKKSRKEGLTKRNYLGGNQ
jgi:hypothetical protein